MGTKHNSYRRYTSSDALTGIGGDPHCGAFYVGSAIDGRHENAPANATRNVGRGQFAASDAAAGNVGRRQFATSDAAAGNVGRRQFATSDAAARNVGRRQFATSDAAAGNVGRGQFAASDAAAGSIGRWESTAFNAAIPIAGDLAVFVSSGRLARTCRLGVAHD